MESLCMNFFLVVIDRYNAYSKRDGKEIIWKEIDVKEWTQPERHCLLSALKIIENMTEDTYYFEGDSM